MKSGLNNFIATSMQLGITQVATDFQQQHSSLIITVSFLNDAVSLEDSMLCKTTFLKFSPKVEVCVPVKVCFGLGPGGGEFGNSGRIFMRQGTWCGEICRTPPSLPYSSTPWGSKGQCNIYVSKQLLNHIGYLIADRLSPFDISVPINFPVLPV